MEADTRIYYLLSFIFSLIGGILILATSFSCGYGYYTICMFIGSEYLGAYDAFIVMMGIFLILSGIISLGLMLKPELANPNTIRINIIWSLITFILVIVGIIISAVEFESVEWAPEAGFYGGVFGSLISMICLYMVLREGGLTQGTKNPRAKNSPFCVYCGAARKLNSEFCENCGRKL